MAPAPTDWGKLTVVNLRAELKRRGLSVAGRKDELVQRLSEDDANGNGDEEHEEGQPDDHAEDTTASAETTVADEAQSGLAVNANDSLDTIPSPGTVDNAPLSDDEAVVGISAVDATPVPVAEALQDAQKRKRRSVTPPPADDSAPNKRPRVEAETEAEVEAETEIKEPATAPVVEAEPSATLIEPVDDTTTVPETAASEETTDPAPTAPIQPAQPAAAESQPDIDMDADMDADMDVPPAIHPATSALYIGNLMRPLRPAALDEHLIYLAAPPAARRDDQLDPAVLVRSYLDAIKTHAFVIFHNTAAAARVRVALHGRVWPDDSNRRALWVDFVPPESVDVWIERETSGGDSRSTLKKWEVVYTASDNGSMEATLQIVGSGPSAINIPTGPSAPVIQSPIQERSSSAVAFPTGPSSEAPRFADFGNAPRGPRAGGVQQRGSRRVNMDRIQTTRAMPRLDYQTAHPDLAQRRLENIQFRETKGYDAVAAAAAAARGDYSKNNHRYTFEDGALLVDRGPEMFNGIRPPHRERERQMGLGGGGSRGRAGGAFGSDRQMPYRELRRDGPERRRWRR